MNNLQKAAGISAIVEALIYVVAFVFFGAFWAYPAEGTASDKMAYLADNQLVFSAIYFLMYTIFGVFLAVLVIGLYEKLKHTNQAIVKVGSVYGVVWVVLVIASGMLATIGLSHSISIMDTSVNNAFNMWHIFSVLIESLGGGNELVGGLWVLCISLAALKSKQLPRGVNYSGLIVGTAGIATIYPEEIITEIFGLTQIIWFVWLGIALLGHSDTNNPAEQND